jgi:hypothetical protein
MSRQATDPASSAARTSVSMPAAGRPAPISSAAHRDISTPSFGTQDGCHGITQTQVDRVPQHCGPGSRSELIDGVRHFMMAQRPTGINMRIVDFLAA